MFDVSVILCTHNPRREYLARVLEALQNQSLPKTRWELLVVDNKSDLPLENGLDLSWHPAARIIREEEIGLTQARIRGIRESKGDLLVFVDDDNVLNPDYLDCAVAMAAEWTKIGAWSGSVIPEYETPPPDHLKPYVWMLCVREVTEDCWGNSENFESTPFGAGMCIRKHIAEKYVFDVSTSPVKAMLDRRGTSLASSGDIDMARTSLRMGLGTGIFSKLKLVHIIPRSRLTSEYFLKLIEDSTAANYLYSSSKKISSEQISKIDKLVLKYKYLRATGFQKQIAKYQNRGIERGIKLLMELSK
jgi:hypothetical protein